jgi:hypothetical protein
MDMSISKKGPVSQLGTFEKPKILVVVWDHQCQYMWKCIYSRRKKIPKENCYQEQFNNSYSQNFIMTIISTSGAKERPYIQIISSR